MDLTKVFQPDAVVLDFLGRDRDHAILELVKVLEDQGHLASENRDEVLLAFLKRERSSGSGIGSGVAIPHVKTDFVDEIRGVVGICREGLDFSSPDATQVQVVFLFLSPSWAVQENLQLLGMLGALTRNETFLHRIKSATSAAEVHQLLLHAESYL